MNIKYHVKILTLYAFSTENWKRPKAEVDFLMRLTNEFLDVFLPDLIKNNVRIDTIGNTNILSKHTKKAMSYAKEKTKQNNGLLLNYASNYGRRNENIEATTSMIKDIKA